MILVLDIMGSLCYAANFVINGVRAEESDFGYGYDADSENAEDYGCGDRQFIGHPPKDEVLAKYKINEAEYYEVVSKLEEGLSFGNCGWCI